MDTTERRLVIGFYTLLVIIGVWIVSAGIEAKLLLNRLEAEAGVPYQLNQRRFDSEEARFYHEEVHLYYYGYRQWSARETENDSSNPWRESSGTLLYFFGSIFGSIYMIVLFVGTTAIGTMAYRGEKRKQPRNYQRFLFWIGVLILSILPFVYQAIKTISYITE